MNRKRLAGAAIAALVGIGMLGVATPAAAGPGDDATITITGPAVSDRTFAAYKLANYTAPDGILDQAGKWSFELDTEAVLGTEGLAALVDYVATTSTSPAYDAAAQGLVDPLTWVATNWVNDQGVWNDATSAAPNVRALANELASKLAEYGLATPVTGPSPLTVTEGLYLVVDTSAEAKGLTMSLPMIIGTQFMDGDDKPLEVAGGPTGVIDVKGDLVDLDKDIVDAIGETNSNGDVIANGNDARTGTEDEDSWTYVTGTMAKFIIRTNVPLYAGSHPNPVFRIQDKWSAGLEAPDPAGMVVTAADRLLVNPEDYSVNVDATAQTFTIELVAPEDHPGDLTVTYSAQVNAGGSTVTKDRNQAWVEFTNNWGVDANPTEPGPGTPDGDDTVDKTAPDEVDVFTFPLDVRKADLTDPETSLVATFLVKDSGDNVVGMITTKADGTEAYVTAFELEEGKYTPTEDPIGLAGDAKYKVEEYTVPTGYTELNKTVAVFWVSLVANDLEAGLNDGTVNPAYYFTGTAGSGIQTQNALTAYFDPVVADEDGANNASVLVLNAKSASDMPQTGGQILLWVGIAGVLGLGAVSFGVVGIRKSRSRSAQAA